MASPLKKPTATAVPAELIRLKEIGAGLCIMAFPVMLLIGFVTHPNILSFAMVANYEDWAVERRGSFMFHFGHLIVMLAVPVITVACIRLVAMLDGPRAWYGFIGGILGVFGAFMLAVDKGALTLISPLFASYLKPSLRPAPLRSRRYLNVTAGCGSRGDLQRCRSASSCWLRDSFGKERCRIGKASE